MPVLWNRRLFYCFYDPLGHLKYSKWSFPQRCWMRRSPHCSEWECGGRALGTRLSCVINVIVCVRVCVCFFFLPYTRLEDRPAPQLIGLWCRVNSLQPDSSVQAGSRQQGSRGCCKSFPSQRAAQERLFLGSRWCKDFALSSLSLREFVFTSDLFMAFGYYPLSFMHDLKRQKVNL